MFTLSLCMIVKDEEDVIGRCLSCVKEFVDEIIIVDTGSTDKTKEIVSQYTNKIYNFPWINDFSAARNFSFSKATKEYIMWLDADDVINKKNQQALKALKKNSDNSADIIMMKYDIDFDENNNSVFSYYRERIFKRSMNYVWKGEIHEVIERYGKVIYCPISIFHKKIRPNEPERNLKIFQFMLLNGKVLEPRQKYYYARELYYNGKYQEAITEFNNFLQEGKGWIENNISACRDLAICYYEINQESKAIDALFKSFLYDSPRAEICCEIGKYFVNHSNYDIAIFWYTLASKQQINEENGAFILKDSYDFIPYLQLCVCYDRLGNHKKAMEYNEKAGKLKPNNKSYIYNKEYFDNIFKSSKKD